MRTFLKENGNKVLFLLLLSLLLLFWARSIKSQFRNNDTRHDLTTIWARAECAEHFGWEIDPGSETKEKIHIPREFDETFSAYNRLQTICGFDLLRYRDKTATRYTYIVTNYPYELSEPVYINLLVLEDRLIGGDVMTRSIHGFMLPLDRRFTP